MVVLHGGPHDGEVVNVDEGMGVKVLSPMYEPAGGYSRLKVDRYSAEGEYLSSEIQPVE